MIPWLFVITGLDFGMFGIEKILLDINSASLVRKYVYLYSNINMVMIQTSMDTMATIHPTMTISLYLDHFYCKEYMHLVSLYTDIQVIRTTLTQNIVLSKILTVYIIVELLK